MSQEPQQKLQPNLQASQQTNPLPNQPPLGTDLPTDTAAPTLSAWLEEARSLQHTLQREGCVPNPQLSEIDNTDRQRGYETLLAQLIRRQIDCVTKLRKTSTGPAKAGGKRAKKAPLDLAALEESILG